MAVNATLTSKQRRNSLRFLNCHGLRRYLFAGDRNSLLLRSGGHCRSSRAALTLLSLHSSPHKLRPYLTVRLQLLKLRARQDHSQLTVRPVSYRPEAM